MMSAQDLSTAFQAASGVAPSHLSLLLRTILLACTLLWAGWVIAGAIHHWRHPGAEGFDFVWFLLRLMLVVCITAGLVFE